ncbi:MAG TPA: hypothetical protein VF138_06095 [Caulobacteraceae bacterium]
MKTILRWILPVLLAANGLFMLLAPGAWYPAVPGVTETGPYNPHFVRDIGAAYLACAAGLGWWAAGRGAGAVIPVAVFLGLHMAVHFLEAVLGHHAAGDIGRDFVGVYLPALIAIWIGWRGVKSEA